MKRLFSIFAFTACVAFGGVFQPVHAATDSGLITSPTYKDLLGGLESAADSAGLKAQNKKSLEEQIMDLIKYALGFMAIIAFTLIIYGGLKLLTAGGDADAIGKSKDILLFAFLGLIVVSFSLTMVGFVGKGIDVILGTSDYERVGGSVVTSSDAGLDVSRVVSGTALGQTVDPKVSVLNAIKYVLSFVAIIALIFVIYGGVRWMTAGGNPDNVKAAQITLRNALLGLLVIIFSLSITMLAINAILVADPSLKNADTDNGLLNTEYAQEGDSCLADDFWSSDAFNQIVSEGDVKIRELSSDDPEYQSKYDEITKDQLERESRYRCASGLYCINGTCKMQKSERNEPCVVNIHCASGLSCKEETGVLGLGDGKACNPQTDVESNGYTNCTCY